MIEAARQAFLADMRVDFEAKGILTPKQTRRYSENLVWHKTCIVCGNENPAGMARVCSSKCYLEAPLQGKI